MIDTVKIWGIVLISILFAFILRSQVIIRRLLWFKRYTSVEASHAALTLLILLFLDNKLPLLLPPTTILVTSRL